MITARFLVVALFLLPGCLEHAYAPTHQDALFAPCGNQPGCRVEEGPNGSKAFILEDAVLQAPPLSAAVHLTAVGTDTVTLRNVTIRTEGQGILVSADCTQCRIVIEDSRLEGSRGAPVAIDAASLAVDAPLRLEVRNVTISGFEHAILGPQAPFGGLVARVQLIADDTDVRCGRTAIRGHFATIQVNRPYITGCRETAMNLVAAAATVEGGFLGTSEVGLESDITGLLRIDGTAFSFNRHYGLRSLRGDRIEVTNASFLGNGQDPGPFDGAGALVQVGGFIHASSFLFNEMYGVANPLPFDATDNYWGSSTGPTLCTGTNADVLAPGDCVAATTQFVPFRSTPP